MADIGSSVGAPVQDLPNSLQPLGLEFGLIFYSPLLPDLEALENVAGQKEAGE